MHWLNSLLSGGCPLKSPFLVVCPLVLEYTIATQAVMRADLLYNGIFTKVTALFAPSS